MAVEKRFCCHEFASPRSLFTLALSREQAKEGSFYLFPEVLVITVALWAYRQLLPEGPSRQSQNVSY